MENSMNWHLVTYADGNFTEQQKYLHRIHKDGFIHHPFNRKQLEATKSVSYTHLTLPTILRV